jgi:hypothetical protein
VGMHHLDRALTELALVIRHLADPFEVDRGSVRICAAVRSSAFRILSRQDFLGGGGRISSDPRIMPGGLRLSKLLRNLKFQVC